MATTRAVNNDQTTELAIAIRVSLCASPASARGMANSSLKVAIDTMIIETDIMYE